MAASWLCFFNPLIRITCAHHSESTVRPVDYADRHPDLQVFILRT